MQWAPEQLELLRRASGLSLDAEGELRHEGEPIAHPGLHRLFHAGLGHAADGAAIVRVGEQWAYVRCAGPVFVVQRMRARDGHVELALNTGEVLDQPLQDLRFGLHGDHELRLVLTDGRVARLGRRAWHALAGALEQAEDGSLQLALAGMLVPVAVDTPV